MSSGNQNLTYPTWPYRPQESNRPFKFESYQNIYKPGELIVSEGSYIGNPLMVTEGLVKVVKGKGENAVFLWFASGGDFLGIDSLFSQDPVRFNAYAVTLTRIASVPREQFSLMAEVDPEAFQQLIKNLCKKVRFAEERVAAINFDPVRQRLAQLLIHLSDQPRYGNKRTMVTEFSYEDITHICGASPAYFNKIMKKLKSVVKIEGYTITIYDRPLLDRLAKGEVPDKDLRPGSK